MAPLGDAEEPQYRGGVMLAADKIRSNFTAHNYNLNISVIGDSEPIMNSLDMIQNLGVVGVVGPAYSGASSIACLITGAFQVPSISFYATGTDLSNPDKYPFFNRVMPDDYLQVKSILLLAQKYGWERISCVHTNEDYGIGGANILVREANAIGIAVNTIQSIDVVDGDVEPPEEEYDRVFKNLDDVKARVIVAYALFPSDCLALWKYAEQKGFLNKGFTWIVTDGCAELTDGKEEYLKGVIALFPNYGLGNTRLEELETQIVSSSVYNPEGYGYFKGTSFSYDAADALLRGILNVINIGGDYTNGKQVLDSIRSLNFEGVTGTIGFDSDTGDRKHGIFSILNLIDIEKGSFDKIGEIDPNSNTITLNQDIIFVGDTTDIPSAYEVIKYIVALNSILGAIAGLCVLFVLFIGFIIIFQWRKFRYSSPLFCVFIILGALLGLASVFTLLPNPNSELCLSFPWLLGIGFVLLFGTLFTKTWRTWRLFHNARKFKIIRISNKMMFLVVGSFVLFEAIFMILWSTLGDPNVSVEPIYKSGQAQLQCTTNSAAWWYVFVFYKVFYVIVGVFLAFKTRDVVDSLNESKPISFSLYNLTFVMTISIPLGFILTDYPTAVLVIQIVAILLCFTTTVGLLFLPKVWKIVSGQQHSMDSPSSGDSSNAGTGGKSGGYYSGGYTSNATEMKQTSIGRSTGQNISTELNSSQNANGGSGSGVFYTGGESLPKSAGSSFLNTSRDPIASNNQSIGVKSEEQ